MTSVLTIGCMLMVTTLPAQDQARDEVTALMERLDSPEAADRRAAARELAALGPRARDAVAPLIQRFGDADRDVAMAAALALTRIGSAAARPLIEALQDGNGFVRWGAAFTLGLLDPPVKEASALLMIGKEAAPFLLDATKDRNKRIRSWATVLLEEIQRGIYP